MAAVGGDAVDWALVTFQLPQSPQCAGVPQLEHPSSAAAQQSRGPRDDTQRTNPVTMGVRDLLLARDKQSHFDGSSLMLPNQLLPLVDY